MQAQPTHFRRELGGLHRRSAQVPHAHQVVSRKAKNEHSVYLEDPTPHRVLQIIPHLIRQIILGAAKVEAAGFQNAVSALGRGFVLLHEQEAEDLVPKPPANWLIEKCRCLLAHGTPRSAQQHMHPPIPEARPLPKPLCQVVRSLNCASAAPFVVLRHVRSLQIAAAAPPMLPTSGVLWCRQCDPASGGVLLPNSAPESPHRFACEKSAAGRGARVWKVATCWSASCGGSLNNR